MNISTGNTLPKKERLFGKNNISMLLAKGKYGNVPGMRFLYLGGTGKEENRIMVSVSKKYFKRAVKRNLLKRRIRECYRKQKHDLKAEGGLDVLFMYVTKEVMSYEEIYACMSQIIEKMNQAVASNTKADETVAE